MSTRTSTGPLIAKAGYKYVTLQKKIRCKEFFKSFLVLSSFTGVKKEYI